MKQDIDQFKMSEKWDYKVVRMHAASTNMEEELKSLGQDGWELVSAMATQTMSLYIAILKRKL